jgi:hypothetical protein
MREFDFIEFHKNLQKDFLGINSIVSDIERFQWHEMYTSEIYDDEENNLNKERLKEALELIKLKIEFAYEYLSLTKMSETLKNDLNKYEGKFDTLAYIPYLEVFYSPIEWILGNHLSALTSHVKIEEGSEYEHTSNIILLERILRGTPKMLSDRNIQPSNESEVRNEVYNSLIHVFPDTVREIPISKVSKTYKPDIGVKGIKSAIEYKFVDSEQEAKTAIGGVFEDIQGYEGSEDWTTFYAVIYMTDNFMTFDQVEAEFVLSKVPHHWKPIVVFGKGKRKPVSKSRKLNS